jgi:ComF family protein
MSVVDLLFPKFCLGCGWIGGYICPRCYKKLAPVTKDICFYCQRPSRCGLTHPGCTGPNRIDGAISIFWYNSILKRIIKSIKYRLAVDVWREFCVSLAPDTLEKIAYYKSLCCRSFLQPIPLHPSRLRERGFNQAEKIARFLGTFFNLPQGDFLKRIKRTFPQAEIDFSRKRILNMRGAFGIKNRNMVKGKNIILVDDVLTTGATVKEAVRILKKYGALKIYVFTLAKG